MSEIPVRDAMKSDLLTVNRSETMDKVARLMTQWNIPAVIVIDGTKPIGMVTEKDVLEQLVAEDRKPSKVHAEDIMSSPLVTIGPEETMSEALDKMIQFDVSRLPVVEGTELIGIVSKADLSNAKERGYSSYEPLEDEKYDEEDYPYGPAICEICGQHNTHLRVVNGRYVCDDCANIAQMDTL